MAKNKYVARVPATSGDKKWRYFYSNDEYQAYLKNKSAVQNQQLKNNLGYKLGKAVKSGQVKEFGKQVSAENKKIQNTNAQLQNQKNQNNVGTQVHRIQQTVQKHREAQQAKLNAANKEILSSGKARMRAQQKQAQQSPEYQAQLKKQNAKNAINAAYRDKQAADAKTAYERSPQYAKDKQKAHESAKDVQNRTTNKTKYASEKQSAHESAKSAQQKQTSETAKRKAEAEYERSAEYQDLRAKKAAVDGFKNGVKKGGSTASTTKAKDLTSNKTLIDRGREAVDSILDSIGKSVDKVKSKAKQIKSNSSSSKVETNVILNSEQKAEIDKKLKKKKK